MNSLTTGDFNASKSHLLTWYPTFSRGMEIVEHYHKVSDSFLYSQPHGTPREPMTMDYFLEYLGTVFTKTFFEDEKAQTEIHRVVGLLRENDKHGTEGTVAITPQEIIGIIRSEPSLQTDFITWMITLALAHIQGSREERKGEIVATSAQDSGICPACGIMAHYGTLRGEEGYRDLACWHCGFVWTIERLKCPYCGETDQSNLGFFEAKEFQGCRIHFCQQCKSYVKVFDFRQVAGFSPVLMLYHLATLVMDDLAIEEGFQPGSELFWSSTTETKAVTEQS